MPEFTQGVSWSDDEIGSTDKLNTMAQNDNALFSMMPHFLYRRGTNTPRDFSESQSAVLKPVMIAGTIQYGVGGSYSTTRTISFPAGTFAAGCRPIIMTQIAGKGKQRFALSTISGTDGSIEPKSDGFRVRFSQRDGNKFDGPIRLHYIAFGWQEA